MDDQTSPSCWGLTAKVVIGIAAVMFLTWLIGGPEATAILARAG